MKLQLAQRNQIKLRLGLSGASGFGKTYSALLLAYGITNDWSKIAIIDTENNSANLYAHLGNFNVLPLNEPYSPERYINAIKTCENASVEVIILDSISQEWNGSGGCLQLHEQLGGKFNDWSKITPRHQAFINAILESSCHIITTVRSKVDYSLDADQNGKFKVVKHGMKMVTRSDFEYELTVNFELINDKHVCKASKDRSGLFMGKPEFIINSATGRKLLRWCNEGLSLDQAITEIDSCASVDGLRDVYSKYSGLQRQIHPYLLKRKEALESVKNQIIDKQQITEPTNSKTYGTHNK